MKVHPRDAVKISAIQARTLSLNAGAGFQKPGGIGPDAVGNLVERIGFVQIDTISVVERAHHHIIASRLPGYKVEWLETAPVFEYWAHAAAYLPWKDFRHTLPRKERIRSAGHDWFRVEQAETERVMERIRAEGPLMARDFEAPRKTVGWWDWKPSKRALEYLFHAGELMALPRRGFQKVLDLTERVLAGAPPGTELRSPTPEEHAAWYVDRALDAWGIVALDEIAYQRREHVKLIERVLADGEDAGELGRIQVEGIPKTVYWARNSDVEKCDTPIHNGRELFILSPFDPFLIHRKRIRRLFNFDFTIECYVPEARRTFGYFALPLLRGTGFVGLLDAKADRPARTLLVNRIRYDGPARQKPVFDRALEKALERFAAFNGLETWKHREGK